MPPEVLQRYSTEKKDERKQFIFVTEFMRDPSFGKMLLRESHYKKDEDISSKDKGWKTINQVADHDKVSVQKAQQLVEGKEKAPNPDFPDDEEMVLYKVFLGEVESNKETKGHKTELVVEAKVAAANASMAQGIVDEMTGGDPSSCLKQLLNRDVLPEDDGTAEGKGRKRKLHGRGRGNKKGRQEKDKSLKWMLPVGADEDTNTKTGAVGDADPEKSKEEVYG